MREITLYPGTPAHPQEIPSTPVSPIPGWPGGTAPVIICDASGMAVDPLSRWSLISMQKIFNLFASQHLTTMLRSIEGQS